MANDRKTVRTILCATATIAAQEFFFAALWGALAALLFSLRFPLQGNTLDPGEYVIRRLPGYGGTRDVLAI